MAFPTSSVSRCGNRSKNASRPYGTCSKIDMEMRARPQSKRDSGAKPEFRSVPPAKPERQESRESVSEEFRAYAENAAREAASETSRLLKESDQRIASMVLEAHVPDSELLNAVKEAKAAAEPATGVLMKMKKKFRKLMPWVLGLSIAHQMDRMEQPEAEAHFSNRTAAAAQLEKEGITDERKEAYTPGVNDAIFHSITPYEYQTPLDLIKNLPDTLAGKEVRDHVYTLGPEWKEVGAEGEQHKTFDINEQKELLDAWRFYLGIPQESGTFKVSEFRPAHATEDKYYYSMPGWLDKFTKREEELQKDRKPIEVIVKTIEHSLKVNPGEYEFDHPHHSAGDLFAMRAPGESVILGDDVMASFRLSKGHDERGEYISYYDKWDFGPTIEGETGLFGKPFEIYDRIYYNPTTFEVIQPVSGG